MLAEEDKADGLSNDPSLAVDVPTTPTLTGQTNRIVREGSWVLIGQAFGVTGSLMAVKVLTRLLDPVTYGQMALGMTVATLVTQCVLGPLANGAIRFYAPAQETREVRAYLGAVGTLSVWATVGVVLVVLIVVSCLVITHQFFWVTFAVAASLYALLSGYNSVLSGVQSAARQRFVVAFHQGAEPWLRFLCAAALITKFGRSGSLALLGSALAVVLVLASQYAFFYQRIWRQTEGGGSVETWRRLVWNFSRPFSLWGAFTWAQLASDRWSLQVFANTRDVGTYAVLFQLGYQPISLAIGMVMQLLTPIFYQRVGDAKDSERRAIMARTGWRLTFVAIGATIAGFILAEIFHKKVFRPFVTSQYEGISYLLPWMVLAAGIFAAAQFMALNLMSQMKTSAMVGVKIGTAVVGVLLNVLGARLWGTPGVVAASVLFSISYFMSLAFVAVREEKIEIRAMSRS